MGLFQSRPIESKEKCLGQSECRQARYLLFDLNKTLTEHVYVPNSIGNNSVRPGIEHLHRLLPMFQLGIYSSSSPKTVAAVTDMIQQAAGEGEHGMLFDDPDMILHRFHTMSASEVQQERSGKSWDTVKPMHPYFLDMDAVLLIDDEPSKVMTQEISNLITIPPWSGNDDDKVLELLVDAILDVIPDNRTVDLRDYSSQITKLLWKSV